MLEIFKITECTLIYSPIPSSIPQYAPETTYQKAALFKYKINKNLRSPPKFYNAGKRKGQILQTRLRKVCSSQNSDLYRKNIVHVPKLFCRCGVFESRNLFFLAFLLYSLDRLGYLPANLDNLISSDLCLDAKIKQTNLANPVS